MATHKHNFSISEKNKQQLEEIQRRFGLGNSDSVRRGIDMLHGFLCRDLKPTKDPEALAFPRIQLAGAGRSRPFATPDGCAR